MGEIPPIAAVSPADEAEVKEIPSAAAQTGQLQHEQWEFYYRLLPTRLTWSRAPLSCACADEGTPLAGVGPSSRQDAGGRAAFELCGLRLNRCKGKLMKRESMAAWLMSGPGNDDAPTAKPDRYIGEPKVTFP